MNIMFILFMAIAYVVILSEAALAYIGPGVGLTTIGSAIALLGAIFLAIMGFIWYPVKRLVHKIKRNR